MNRLRVPLIISAVLACVYCLMFGFMFEMYDTRGYTEGAKLLFGLGGGENIQFRVVKPFALIIPGLFELAGFGAEYGLFLQNLACFIACGPLVYLMGYELRRNERFALMATLVYFTCQPLMVYGLAFMTDMPGWFSGLLVIYLILKRQMSVFWMGMLAGAGLLLKESAVTGAVFVAVFLAGDGRWRDLGWFCSGLILPVVTVSFYTWQRFGFTSVEWYLEAAREGVMYTATGFFLQLVRVLDVYWFLAMAGFVTLWKKRKEIGRSEGLFYLAGMGVMALFPLWPYAQDRIFFMSAPFLAVAAAEGAFLFRRRAVAVVIAGGAVNILLAWMIYRFKAEGLLPWAGAGYLALLAIMGMVRK